MKTEIERKLAELKSEAEKAGFNLFAVLQDQDDLLIESDVSNQVWNDADDAKNYSCEDLDLDSELYQVMLIVAKA